MDKSDCERQRGLRPWQIAAALLLPLSAWAQLAITTQDVNVRAGPDRDYPLVTWLPAGTTVNIAGCTQGWRWCDVGTGYNRGWVYARFLSTTPLNQPTVIISAGPQIGLPVITFSLNTYWGLHYRNRPWWQQRNVWANRPPPRPPTYRPPPPVRPPEVRPPSRPPGWQPPPPSRPPPPPVSRPPPERPPNVVRPPGVTTPPGGPPPGARPPPSGGPGPGARPPPPGGPGPGTRPSPPASGGRPLGG